MTTFTTQNNKVTFNGKRMNLFTALYSLYENQNINAAIVDGRLVYFDNTGWFFADEAPKHAIESALRDAERMFYGGNVITC